MSSKSDVVALLIICLMCLGCGNSANPSARPAIQVAQGNAENPVPGLGEAAAPAMARKIIYTSQIDVVVDDIAAAQKKLTSLIESVREKGGFLARQELNGTSGSRRRSTWTIRVPLLQFDGFVAEVEKLGELERSTRDAQDVTEAYSDLEARLRNKESSEKRLLSHLEKSAVLKDTLELERELSRVRGEVEQLQGQLNLLKNKTDLATVSLTMYERQDFRPTTKPTFATLVSRTFEGSWKSLISFGQVLVLVVVGLSPWVAALCVLLLPTWMIRRSLKRA